MGTGVNQLSDQADNLLHKTGSDVGNSGTPGVGSGDFDAAVQKMIDAFNLATERNIYLRTLTTELGTVLNAAKKDVNPK